MAEVPGSSAEHLGSTMKVSRQHGGAPRKYVDAISATREGVPEVRGDAPEVRQGVDPVQPDRLAIGRGNPVARKAD